MARLRGPEQLEAYRQQQVEIARKIKKAETKRRAKEKADEHRRQLLVGAAALDYFAQPAQLDHRADFLRALFKGRKLSAADLTLFRELMQPPETAGQTS